MPATSRRRAIAALSLAAALLGARSVADAAGRPIRLAKPRRGAQIVVGPVTVPRGTEVTECTRMKFPVQHDMAVNRVKIKVRGASHHIHLYRPYDQGLTLPDGHETCDFALDFDVWQLVLASQNLLLNWKLPPGVAFHFRGGEQLLAQTHFVDTGLLSSPEDGWAVFNLYAIPKRKVESYAGALFGQDRDVVVPPHAVSTATTRCVFPKPVKLLALTGHYHFRGARFTAGAWDGERSGPALYDFEGYQDPAFWRYGGGSRQPPEVQGLEWTCTYQNDTDQTFLFGPFTDRHEHCNLFAFYYPTLGPNEFMTCVQDQGVVTVNVGR
jgi:hypothetical protein